MAKKYPQIHIFFTKTTLLNPDFKQGFIRLQKQLDYVSMDNKESIQL